MIPSSKRFPHKPAARDFFRVRRTRLAARAYGRLTHRTRGRACVHLMNALLPHAPRGIVVSFYHASKGECDVSGVARHLRKRGYRLALPVIVAKDAPLAFRHDNNAIASQLEAYDIPVPPSFMRWQQPRIFLVPLLAFDTEGRRLGYGGGYYDRTLRLTQRRHTLAIGIAFAQQHAHQLPHDAYDERLDAILTPCATLIPQRRFSWHHRPRIIYHSRRQPITKKQRAP